VQNGSEKGACFFVTGTVNLLQFAALQALY